MKHLLIVILFSCISFTGCKKDITNIPEAAFSFRGDTSSVFKMATYDTCTLVNNSINSDSTFWDMGNGQTSMDKNLILTYTNSGTYTIKLTVKSKNGQQTSATKKVVVLDRVLKKIIIKKVYWDTVPNSLPHFNAVWPASSQAAVFVKVQKLAAGDSIVPYSGIMPNSSVLYESPVIENVSNNTTVPIEINVPGKFVVDKKMVLDKSFVINLMAKDSNNMIYALQTSLAGGVSFGIMQESFADNKFVVVCDLFSSVEFDCAFE